MQPLTHDLTFEKLLMLPVCKWQRQVEVRQYSLPYWFVTLVSRHNENKMAARHVVQFHTHVQSKKMADPW